MTTEPIKLDEYDSRRFQHLAELQRLADWAWGWILQTQVVAENEGYALIVGPTPELDQLKNVLDHLAVIDDQQADDSIQDEGDT